MVPLSIPGSTMMLSNTRRAVVSVVLPTASEPWRYLERSRVLYEIDGWKGVLGFGTIGDGKPSF